MESLKKISKDMQEYIKRGNVIRRCENKLHNLLIERDQKMKELGKQFSSKLKGRRFINRQIKDCLKKINVYDSQLVENTKILNSLEREKKDSDVGYKEEKANQKTEYINLIKKKEVLTDKYIELKKRLGQQNKELRKQGKGILGTFSLSQNGSESEVGALQDDIEAINISFEKLKSDAKKLEKDNIENNDKLNASIIEINAKQQMIEAKKDVDYIELGKLTLSKRTRDKNIVKTKKRLQVIDKLKLELEHIIKNGKMTLESDGIKRTKWLMLIVGILTTAIILGIIYLLFFSNILL